MKCPRAKFTDLNYSGDIEQQKKEICRSCSDYKGEQFEWGTHCDAHLICQVTGQRLGPEAFERLPRDSRPTATHSLSEEGKKVFNTRLDSLKKKTNRPLW